MRFNLITLLAALPALLAAPTSSIESRVDIVPRAIPGSWIVRLDDNTILAQALATAGAAAANIGVTFRYSLPGFSGFAFQGTQADAEIIKALAIVKYVEQDSTVSASALTTQASSPWGLSRISHRSRGATNYIYDATAGSGTFSYIIDTGINTAHQDFAGRASMGANYISGESSEDGNGHGTHVSGTVGGATFGVAKKTTLIGVKVLSNSGSGTSSGVLAGINWAVNDAVNKGRTAKSVINMSLGGDFSQSTNDAVTAATKNGIFVAVAAGNSGVDAKTQSPASAPAVCTVGATDINDAKPSFSNYGSVVDIFGPGVNILSTWIGSTTATNTISGTSMASPHIAGLGAYLIGLEGSRTAAALCSRIQSLATKNTITGAGSGSPNSLAYNGNGA